MTGRLRFTVSFEEPDEDGWVVARIVEIPGAVGQGKSRPEARDDIEFELRTMA